MLYWKLLNVLNHSTVNNVVSDDIYLTTTLHQAGKVKTWEVKDQFVIIFFLKEILTSEAKDDKINYMTGIACLETSGSLYQETNLTR